MVGQQEAEKKMIESLFKAGAHFGYSRTRRYPKMEKFIFALRNNIEIIDLSKTVRQLEEAKEFLSKMGREEKTVLFVGTKENIKFLVERYAKEIGMPYVVERWIGGTLSNFGQIKKRSEELQKLIEDKEKGAFEKYTKKERLMIDKKIEKMKKYFYTISNLTSLPSALVVVDTREEDVAVKEAKDMSIPVVGIMNVDCNPDDADYPIPANDNSVATVDFLLSELVSAYKKGLSERELGQEEDETGKEEGAEAEGEAPAEENKDKK